MDATSERIANLEAALTHLERQYDQLNEIVIRQEKQLLRLSAVTERVDNTLHDMELDGMRSNNARPPHYGNSTLG